MNALLIPAGKWQFNLAVYLKSKGIHITAVNPFKTITTGLADEYICADVRNIEAILNKPDIVVCDESDVGVLPVAQLCHKFGIKGIPELTLEIAKLYINKLAMCEYAKSLGIPVPELTDKFPFVVKPVDSTASRGFAVIRSSLDVDKIDNAIKQSPSGNIITQDFIEGTEYTLEGVCIDGIHTTLTASIKTHFRPGVASSLRYPAIVPEKMIFYNNMFVFNSGLKNGVTHAEYMVDKTGKIWFIEIAARGGGCNISSRIVPWVTGVEPFACVFERKHPISLYNRPAILMFYEFTKPVCQEFIRGNLDCSFFDLNISDYKPALTDSDRHLMVILTAESNEELDNKIAKVNNTIENSYEK